MQPTSRRQERPSIGCIEGAKSVLSRKSRRFSFFSQATRLRTSQRPISAATAVTAPEVNNHLRDTATMIQLFASVYLLDGTVGKRPIYLPLPVGWWCCLLLDTVCSYPSTDIVLP